jgi:hypothetical protein
MTNRTIQPKRRIVILPFIDNGGPLSGPAVSFQFDSNSVLHHVSSTVEIAITAVATSVVVAGGVNLQGPPQVIAPFSQIEDGIHYYAFQDFPGAVLPISNVFSDRTDFDATFVKAGSVFNVWSNKSNNAFIRGAFILHISTTSEWVNFEEKVKRF